MKSVYLLRSLRHPEQRYVGVTSDIAARLGDHNEGRSSHTSKFRPWVLVTAISFEDDQRALDFERYLKSGSGRAFASKHLW